jgi:hypothetical protein
MLGQDSTWSEKEESDCNVGGLQRRLHTVKLLDCDYASFCWILKWLYTDESRLVTLVAERSLIVAAAVLFQKEVDAREGPITFPGNLLDATANGGALGWEWQEVSQDEDEMPSEHLRKASTASAPPSSTTKSPTTRKRSMTPTFASSRRNASANAGRVSPVSPQSAASSATYATFTALEAKNREDPHPHPFTREQAGGLEAASALSVFRIAHLYQLDGLAQLALDHLVQHLTPDTAFPLYLATHLYSALSDAIIQFICSHYHAVTASAEFGRCVSEVAAGLWPASGAMLQDFFKLLAPSPRAP